MFMPSSLGMALPRAKLDPVDESVWYPEPPKPETLIAGTDPQTVGLNVGMVFTAEVTGGSIHSMAYYRADAAMASSGTLALWQISDPPGDTLLASVDFTGHSGVGWVVVPLDEAIPVTTTKGYLAHLWTPSNGTHVKYAATLGAWSRGHLSTPWGFLNGVPSNGQGDPRGFLRRNGMYGYGVFARPILYTHSNYWVDVVINARPTPIPPDPPLTLKWPILEGFPTPETTGADEDTVFTVENENIGSTADGQIIEDIDFRTGVFITHNNVTLRNCKLKGQFGHIVYIYPGVDGTIVEDCSIDGVGKKNLGVNGITIGGNNTTIRRCKVYRCENTLATLSLADGILIEDCLMYNLRAGPSPPSPHYDTLQIDAGVFNCTFRHNTLYNEHNDTAVVMLGLSDNVLVEDNYLCGAGYTCYVDDRHPVGPITNARYYNNKLRMGFYGYYAINLVNPSSTPAVFEGNQYVTHGSVFDVPPPTGFADGQIVPESFWGTGALSVPGSIIGEPVTAETGGLTLGLSFTPLVDGEIAGINFYRPHASTTIRYKVGVWRYTGSNPDAGTELLATQEYTNVIKGGLNYFELTTPLPVTALQNYLVAVWIPRGPDGHVYYVNNAFIFGSAPIPSQWGRMMAFSNNPALPYNGFTGRNSTYNYGPDLAPPVLSGSTSSRYWVEPIFVAPWMVDDVAHGTVNATLGALTLAGTATVTAAVPGTAALNVTLGALSLAATATVSLPAPYTATLAATLGDMTLAATSITTLPGPATATLATTLGALTLISTGIAIPSPREATLAKTLGALTLVSAVVNNPDLTVGGPTNTGVPPGTVLTSSGKITTTSHGQIIQNMDVTSSGTGIEVNHNNVIIRRCRITSGDGNHGIDGYPFTGTIIEDCEIIGDIGNCGFTGFGHVRRCNIHGYENGVNITDGSGGSIMNSWLHTLNGGPTAHHDTIQDGGAFSNFEIAYNTLENLHTETSCVMITNAGGACDNIDVHDNVMVGGGGYTVYSYQQVASPGWSGLPLTNIKFRNNRMDQGFYGYHSFLNNTPVFTGNTNRLTGAPIT